MFVPISNSVVAGRYELIDEIGRGGMGVVWRARQTNLGVECAIKFIHAAQAHEPEMRRRFVREARAAAIPRGPHAVHILDVDEWQGTLFIAMELLHGESLEARLSREKALSLELALAIIEQVARGLTKAHAAKLVHRDLKPENIFLVEEEPLLVKILDFGIAKRFDASSGLHTTSGVLVGTPAYMSPEQADGGKELDYRSDLWSLAVVAFRCLTGAAPFDGEGLGQVLVKVMTGPIPAPRDIRPSLPARVDEWWFRVIQRDPALRPPSATALASGLREALAGGLSPPSTDAEPGRVTGVGSLQPTLQPVSGGPTRRLRPLRRQALGALGAGVLLLGGWGAAERWLAATSRSVSAPPIAGAAEALPVPHAASPGALRELALGAASGANALAAEAGSGSTGPVIGIAPVLELDATPLDAAAPEADTPGADTPGADRTAAQRVAVADTPARSATATPRAAARARAVASPASRGTTQPVAGQGEPGGTATAAAAMAGGAAQAASAPPSGIPTEPPAPEQNEPEADVFSKPSAPRGARANDPRLGF